MTGNDRVQSLRTLASKGKTISYSNTSDGRAVIKIFNKDGSQDNFFIDDMITGKPVVNSAFDKLVKYTQSLEEVKDE